MRTTDTASRPNLARLSREDRIDIAVAEARGAAWETDGNRWRLLVGGKYVATVWAEGFFPIGLPNITSDPAAWGALMETEFSGWETARFGAEFRHQVRWHTHTAHGFKKGPWAASLPAAVCEGVLAKYGVEVPS